MVDNIEDCALAGAYLVAQGLAKKYEGNRPENGYPKNCFVYLGNGGYVRFNPQSPDYAKTHPAGGQVCK